jgi:hypothetical protein
METDFLVTLRLVQLALGGDQKIKQAMQGGDRCEKCNI